MTRASFSKLYAALLVLFPILSSYDFIGISPTLIFGVIAVVLAFFCKKQFGRIRVDKRTFVYVIYMLLSAVIGIFHSEQNSLYTLAMKCITYTLLFYVFYVISWQVIDVRFTMDLYARVAAGVSILVVVQFFASLAGSPFSLVIPGVPTVGDNGILTDQIIMNQLSARRFSSVFLEPAHQCEYVVPCIALLLFKGDKNTPKGKDIAIALLLTVGCVCTTSSIGIISSIIIWGLWVLTLMKRNGVNGFFYLIVIVPLIMIAFVYFSGFNIIIENLLLRLQVLDLRNTSMTEGFRRIRYGWLCFGDMSTIYKIFGAGYQNFGYYIVRIGTGFKYYQTNDLSMIAYTNGITGMLIGLGVVGTILNLRIFLWDLLKSKIPVVYGLVLTWALIMFSSNSFDSVYAMLPIIIAMSITYSKRYHKHYIAIKTK